jgi:uncharacterized membrane protein HdeD (DUF308 family)
MATANPSEALRGPATVVKKVSGWVIAMSIVFIILGIMAIVEPEVAGLAVTLLVGWLLIFGGVTHLIAAFSGGGPGRVIWHVILGLIYAAGGVFYLMHPGLGLTTLTLLLAGIILAGAVLEFMAYFNGAKEKGSGWLLVNGLIALVVCALIWRHWPSSSAWAIGTLVGVNLLMTGISRLMLGMAARKLAS